MHCVSRPDSDLRRWTTEARSVLIAAARLRWPLLRTPGPEQAADHAMLACLISIDAAWRGSADAARAVHAFCGAHGLPAAMLPVRFRPADHRRCQEAQRDRLRLEAAEALVAQHHLRERIGLLAEAEADAVLARSLRAAWRDMPPGARSVAAAVRATGTRWTTTDAIERGVVRARLQRLACAHPREPEEAFVHIDAGTAIWPGPAWLPSDAPALER